MKATVEKFAEILKVHARTVTRHTTGRPNASWVDGELIPVALVARVFECKNETLLRVLRDRDYFLTPAEAAEMLDISKRTLRDRGYTRAVRGNGVVRYSAVQLMDEEFERSPSD